MIEEKLLRLEWMSHAEKVAYWRGERPWKVDGVDLKLRSPTSFPAGHVELDDKGNITKMPFLAFRPCFGAVSAYLRHGGNQHVFSPRTGGYHPDRCARCPVAEACIFVCEKRLSCTPKIQALYHEWKHRGGKASSWPKKGRPGSASITLRYLLDALKEQTFTSINDQRVQEYYEKRIEQRRQDERERKRRDRVKSALAKAQQGKLEPEVIEILKQQCLWRHDRYGKAWRLPRAPLPLRKAKDSSRTFDSLVWLAWKRLEMRGHQPNASSCATELRELGRECERTHGALRDKVKRSIKRMMLLEAMPMPGDPDGLRVWPPFTIKDLRRELDQHTLHGQVGSLASKGQSDTLQRC